MLNASTVNARSIATVGHVPRRLPKLKIVARATFRTTAHSATASASATTVSGPNPSGTNPACNFADNAPTAG